MTEERVRIRDHANGRRVIEGVHKTPDQRRFTGAVFAGNGDKGRLALKSVFQHIEQSRAIFSCNRSPCRQYCRIIRISLRESRLLRLVKQKIERLPDLGIPNLRQGFARWQVGGCPTIRNNPLAIDDH